MISRFTKLAGALGLAVVLASSAGAQTTTGTVGSNETWSGTVTLTGDVIISSATVTITPGTVIKMATTNDNIVNGTASRINIVVTGTGALIADGTEAAPITFTSTSLFAAKGAWGRIDLMGLSSGNATVFDNCVFEYGQTPLELRNPPGVTTATSVSITDCVFSQCGASALYGTSGCNIDITGCSFVNCGKGVFVHGAADINITGTYFSNMSCAIINAGLAGYEAQAMTINHCTIYNVDMMIAGTSPKWWDGYGIFNTTNGITVTGQFVITNSIVVQATLAGIQFGSWPSTNNNNCWHTGLLGLANIEGGTLGTGSIEQDPMFVNAAAGNLSLDDLSPCIGTASDATNMGAWQNGDPVAVNVRTDAASLPGIRVANPVVNAARFELAAPLAAPAQLQVFTLDGRMVAGIDAPQGARSIGWETGSSVEAGTYLYRVGGLQGLVTVTK